MVVIASIDREAALHDFWKLCNLLIDFLYCDLFPLLLQNHLHLSNSSDAFRGSAPLYSALQNCPDAFNRVEIWRTGWPISFGYTMFLSFM